MPSDQQARNEIGTEEAAALLGSGATWIDLREPEEHASGVIEGAVLVPPADLAQRIDDIAPDKDQKIVIYCSMGQRSMFGVDVLESLGYTSAVSVKGGLRKWKAESRPMVQGPTEDTASLRYARHHRLAEVGQEGQEKLAAASVAIVGAGGLGSPAALYLAAAGVGTLGIIDFDTVDLSNLQRQIIHTTDRVGTPKTRSAARTIEALNPHINVVRHDLHLDASNILETLSGYDVIIDGTDNFPTRYLLNDASLHLRTPVVHAAILRFEGQASVFAPYEGPCYRCLFPEPPPPELAPSCAEAGVLGALAGVMGTLQALEAMKLILGIGESLAGRLMLYDALGQRFEEVRFGRDPSCPACSDEATPPTLIDYDETCRPA